MRPRPSAGWHADESPVEWWAHANTILISRTRIRPGGTGECRNCEGLREQQDPRSCQESVDGIHVDRAPSLDPRVSGRGPIVTSRPQEVAKRRGPLAERDIAAVAATSVRVIS